MIATPWSWISKSYLVKGSCVISVLKWPRCNLPPHTYIRAFFKHANLEDFINFFLSLGQECTKSWCFNYANINNNKRK